MVRARSVSKLIKVALPAGLAMVLAAGPVSATTVNMDMSGPVATWADPSHGDGAAHAAMAGTSDQAGKSARKAAKAAARLAQRCAQWQRKSLNSVKARNRYNASCVSAVDLPASDDSTSAGDSSSSNDDSAPDDAYTPDDEETGGDGGEIDELIGGGSTPGLTGPLPGGNAPPIDLSEPLVDTLLVDNVPSEVPEPGTLALLGLGLAGLGIGRRRRA